MTPLVASQAGVFLPPARLTPGGRLVLDQSLLYQTVSRRLKNIQCESLDAALEKTTPLFTVFGKLRLFLEEQRLKNYRQRDDGTL